MVHLHLNKLIRVVSIFTLGFFIISAFSAFFFSPTKTEAMATVKCDGWANPGETHCNTTACQQFYCNSSGVWENRGAGGVCSSQPACIHTSNPTPTPTPGNSNGGVCTGDKVEIVGYGTNTITARVKSGQSCSAYAYVKKYTCSGNSSTCTQNEQTIAQGSLPLSASPDAPCGKTVQVDIDVYQSAPWANHIVGGGIAKYGGDCAPTPTVTPTPTPTVRPSPTPTVTPTPTITPSPTPTPTPSPTSNLTLCKYEDKNGNGVVDGEDRKISWSFKYKVNNDSEKIVSTNWWNVLNSGCASVVVPVNATVAVGEQTQIQWRQTGMYVDGSRLNDTIYMYTSTANTGKEIWFLNTRIVTATPTPTPSPSPTPRTLTCNATCAVDSDCQSGLRCYQDGTVRYCRHPDNYSSTTCDTRKTGGFFIRKYNDENGNGHQDGSEKGLSWKFQWESNADNNWHDYETFENHLGEGGVVSLPEGTQVRIREKSVDGWTATTATEVTIHITAGNNQMMVFGNWRGKPQVLGISTPKTLPATGFSTAFGAVGSVLMYGVGVWLKKKGI